MKRVAIRTFFLPEGMTDLNEIYSFESSFL